MNDKPQGRAGPGGMRRTPILIAALIAAMLYVLIPAGIVSAATAQHLPRDWNVSASGFFTCPGADLY